MRRSLRAIAIVVTAISVGACGSSAANDDGGPSMQEDANTLDASLSCYELGDRWGDLITDLRACTFADECALVADSDVCDAASIDCGAAVNRAAYESSTAADIEREFFDRGCDSSVSDCPLLTGVDCVGGLCTVVDWLCCYCAPPSYGTIVVADVSAPGHPELGSGARVDIQFAEAFSGNPPAYSDVNAIGDGCIVYVLDAPVFSPVSPLDAGTVTISDVLSPVPPCAFDSATMRYRCIATSGIAQPGDTLQVVGAGEVEVELADAAFDATHVGMHLELSGADDPAADGRFPIVAQLSATRARIALSPLASDSGWSAAGTYSVVGGTGPTPAGVDFLDDGSTPITIEKDASLDSGPFSTTAYAAGEGLTLDPTSTALDGLPTDGSGASFDCGGAGGDCGGAFFSMAILGRTTNAPLTDLPDYAMPPSTSGQIAVWRCQSLVGTPIEIPEGAMAAILGTSPTRIETTVFSTTIQDVADDQGLSEWRIAVGHALTGYTTVP